MSSDLAIRVSGLGKAYTIRHQQNDHVTLAQVALEKAKHPFRRNEREKFWALRDVSFEVEQGEVLGVIGRNGAGKSTLLKLLTRITGPSAGQIDLWGRVGSLLEVGTGFHPELTGRENVYLNGSILGMTRREIDRQFDAIVDFAGVEKFLDTPVKRYSSGMYVRLAFAVAAHLETEILLVDEVLAVGDQEFQKKSAGKMESAAQQGRTVLFVSHNLGLVSQMTHKALLLSDGRSEFFGATDDAIRHYQESGALSSGAVHVVTDKDRWDPRLAREVEILTIRLDAPRAGIVDADDDLTVELGVRARTDVEDVGMHVSVVTDGGVRVCGGFTATLLSLREGERATVVVRLRAPRLAPGRFLLDATTGQGDHFSQRDHFDGIVDVCPFEVAPPVRADGAIGANWTRNWGLVRLEPLEVVDVQRHGVHA